MRYFYLRNSLMYSEINYFSPNYFLSLYITSKKWVPLKISSQKIHSTIKCALMFDCYFYNGFLFLIGRSAFVWFVLIESVKMNWWRVANYFRDDIEYHLNLYTNLEHKGTDVIPVSWYVKPTNFLQHTVESAEKFISCWTPPNYSRKF